MTPCPCGSASCSRSTAKPAWKAKRNLGPRPRVRLHQPYDERLIDAPGAIEARGYDDQVTAEVHLAIDDELAPWNAGNFVLRVDGGKGHLEPGGSGKVALSAGTLASLYTGWSGPDNLASWDLLDGADVVDIAALRRSFSGPTTPWMRDFF